MLGFGWLQCRRVRPVLWDYASERLSEGPMEDVEQHLHGCVTCSREVESLRNAQNFLSACRAEEEPAPPSDWNALRQRLLTQSPAHLSEPSGSRQRSRAVPALLRGGGLDTLRAPWRMQLLTSMAGGFAACGIVALGYGLLMHHQATPGNQSGTSGNLDNVVKNSVDKPVAKQNVAIAPKPDNANAAMVGHVVSIFNNVRVESAALSSTPAKSAWPASSGAIKAVAYKQSIASSPRFVSRTRRSGTKLASSHVLPRQKNTNLTRNQKGGLHFRHYTSKPEDRLPAAEQIASRNSLEQVRPVSNDSEDYNNYIVGTVQPVAHDDDHDY